MLSILRLSNLTDVRGVGAGATYSSHARFLFSLQLPSKLLVLAKVLMTSNPLRAVVRIVRRQATLLRSGADTVVIVVARWRLGGCLTLRVNWLGGLLPLRLLRVKIHVVPFMILLVPLSEPAFRYGGRMRWGSTWRRCVLMIHASVWPLISRCRRCSGLLMMACKLRQGHNVVEGQNGSKLLLREDRGQRYLTLW